MIDIGRVFGTAWAMMRQRFWLLLGMFAVFFAIQLVGSTVLGIVVAIMGVAGAAGIGAGLDDPAAITGMGIGIIILTVLFYGAYLVLVLAQQAAMVTLASPLEDGSFGTAMARGFKSALPFFGITVILMIAYVVIGGGLALLTAAVGLGSETVGVFLAVVMLVLFLPVIIYLGCRMAVLIPVVAVDQVFNPFAAIRRSWAVTRGRALGIFVATLLFVVLTMVIIGLPFLLVFGSLLGSEGEPGAAAVGGILLGFLIFIPLIVAYAMFASAYAAALHSVVTDGGSERLEEVFA
jgi:membrane-anchored glycerophosphoryl diester phosphodiesterase (GDPDase)